MSEIAFHRIREADVWVSTRKAATILGKHRRWLTDHKNNFKFRRKGKRNLEFEITDLIKKQNNHE